MNSRNTTVDLSHIETPANMTSWPLFHNGVAAGLRIANFSQVDSSWIMYNQPKNNELTNEYAGFLMALGLNKHLVKMHILNKHDYLSKVRLLLTNIYPHSREGRYVNIVLSRRISVSIIATDR